MKNKRIVSFSVIVLILVCVFTQGLVNAQNKSEQVTKKPEIRFQELIYDFNEVSPLSYNSGTFKFHNAGTDILRITNISTNCGCTVAELEKKEFAPGEGSEIKATFHAPSSIGPTSKLIYVATNDPKHRTVTLTLKAMVKKQILVTPENLKLSLKKANGGCPDIILKSVDGTPFSITGFKSSIPCITADFNSLVKETSYTLKPIVDMNQLSKAPKGSISITVDHPKSKELSLSYSAPAEFKVSPSILLLFGVEPGKKIVKDNISIMNQYSEEFKIKELKSEKGYVKLLTQKTDNKKQYKLKLEINPPAPEGDSRIFNDNLIIIMESGKQIKAACRGFFKKE